MYDKDLLDENVILKWYKNPPIAEEFSMQDNFNELRENQVGKFILRELIPGTLAPFLFRCILAKTTTHGHNNCGNGRWGYLNRGVGQMKNV